MGMLMSVTTMSMRSSSERMSRASVPLPAKRKLYLPERMWGLMRCLISGSRSGSSSTTRM